MNRRQLRRLVRGVRFLLAALGFWSACVIAGVVYADAGSYIARHWRK